MLPCFHASIISQTKRGFTLSELLISLAVLGLISALTLPSVFNTIESSRKKALFKETINTLQTVINDGMMTGELPALPRNGAFFQIAALKQWFNSKTPIIALDCEAINNSDSRCNYDGGGVNGLSGLSTTNKFKFVLTNGMFMAWMPYPHGFTIYLDYDHKGKNTGLLNNQGQGDTLILMFQAVEDKSSWLANCEGRFPPLGALYEGGSGYSCIMRDGLSWLAR